MKRFYVCAMIMLLCILALPGFIRAQATVSGYAWHDSDDDGIWEPENGESGIPGVAVKLSKGNNEYSTTTDQQGYYSFTVQDAPGNYKIEFSSDIYDNCSSVENNPQKGEEWDSDVEGNGKENLSLGANQNLTYFNAGMLRMSGYDSITGTVWEDENNNGTKDENEKKAVGGVTVTAYFCSGGEIAGSDVTKGNGAYSIPNLPRDLEYRVVFGSKTNYTLSPQGTDSDPNPSTGEVTCATLFAGGLGYDAGMHSMEQDNNPNPQINGILWDDKDGDGFQLGVATEPGIGDWVVNLLGSDGVTVVRSTKTISNVPGQEGRYSFTHLTAGTYYIQFVNPGGYTFTLQNAVNDNRDSDVNPDGLSGPVVIVADAREEHVDAGVHSNTQPPEGKGKISGILWDDSFNKDGLQDGTDKEPGIGSQTVELYLTDGTLYKTTTTEPSGGEGVKGTYKFTEVAYGNYYVKFATLPSGYTFTLKDAGNDEKDSDADRTTGQTGNISVTTPAEITHIDAGAIQGETGTGSIGNFVWLDVDGDGEQNGTEPGVKDVVVELYRWDGTAFVSQGSKTTNSLGLYQFSDLIPGTYKVHFFAPTGFKFTKQNGALNSANNSDADPVPGTDYGYTVEFQLNPSNPSIKDIDYVDAGIIPASDADGSIGDFVWIDFNGNGEQDNNEPGIMGVVVDLYRNNGNGFVKLGSTTTDGGGKYLFSNLLAGTYYVHFNAASGDKFTKIVGTLNTANNSDADPATGNTASFQLDPSDASAKNILYVDAGLIPSQGRSIGDFVWSDSNNNGIQDFGEPGVHGVTVLLYSSDNLSTPKAQDITDSHGKYLFSNLDPGTYRIRFVLPNNFDAFTAMGAGSNDALDSDADPLNSGFTGPVTLLSLADRLDIDAGLIRKPVEKANIGDLVWNDCNRNGIQDLGESGISGVEVKLHLCTSDHTNTNDPCTCGSVVSATKTDKNGKYMFANIMPGYYCVEIVVPCHFTITKPDQADDFKDSDVIPSMKHTGCIKLNPGETNMTVDAGLYPTPPATIGNFVWIDANKNGIQDKGEKGLCNVTVELYMCGVSKPVDVAKTDNDGYYIFKNVIPNTSYSLKFYLPKGYTFTALDQGKDDNFDSDVCAKTCGGMTKFYDIMPDETNLTIDCGMYLATTSACNYVWKDNNNNGVKDDNEAGIQDVTLELYQCSNNTLVQSVKTDAAGLFTFSDILLDTYYLKILVPNGYKLGQASQSGTSESIKAGFGTDGQSSCFDVTDGSTSIGKPVALVLSTTGIIRGSEIPTEFSLQQNYPNPFNPSTTIEFAVPSAGQYTIKVFNMLGQEVSTLLNRELPVGYHMVVFDASGLPSGMYIYRLSGSDVVITKKMMLSK